MASSAVYVCSAILPRNKSKFSQSFQLRAHYYENEGRSRNMVDANLRVLRERIEDIKNRERLERCCVAEPGWNYTPIHNNYIKPKRDRISRRFLQLMLEVGGTLGFTVLSCSFCLYAISLLLHSN
ncbi:uncharacterized protein LOC110013189 [Sesamum indicum]|uniref:Uncharacterized protein LOC110013189 n=1 Tax=Sesamum indicum TaxID=4182 RepID=A0A8M8VED1_SESIN|nr:uncharacterized protein LOC110013189 [Sesamum indicum]